MCFLVVGPCYGEVLIIALFGQRTSHSAWCLTASCGTGTFSSSIPQRLSFYSSCFGYCRESNQLPPRSKLPYLLSIGKTTELSSTIKDRLHSFTNVCHILVGVALVVVHTTTTTIRDQLVLGTTSRERRQDAEKRNLLAS